jgi:hypothetical protein
MPMLLTEEQRMLADTAGHFLTDRAGSAGLRAVRDGGKADGFDRNAWTASAEMGFAGPGWAMSRPGWFRRRSAAA